MIYYKDGAKMMRPIHSREEYLKLRDSEEQQSVVRAVRGGNAQLKSRLIQMNYSCLPNEDGSLKGSTTMSKSVGMDIDHIPPEEMQPLKERILSKKDELGLQMMEKSARGAGYHLAFKRKPELSQEENLQWASELLGVEFDKGAKDIARVFFTTTASGEDLIYLDDELFDNSGAEILSNTDLTDLTDKEKNPSNPSNPCSNKKESSCSYPDNYHGIPFTDIIAKYWEVNNRGFEPTQGDRDTLTYQLACDLRHICGRSFEWLDQVIPCYDGFPLEEKRAKIKSALSSEFNGFPIRLRNVLNALQMADGRSLKEEVEDDEQLSTVNSQLSTRKMPMGVRESIDAVGPQLTMPIVTAICPCIGVLATGVKLDVHGQKKGLNLISYIAGDFASGKGLIDPVVDAWMSEVMALDKMYQKQEDEWRAKKRAAKNKKEQPEEPKLPVRYLTLNNTVANLAHGGTEMEIDDERLLRDAAPEL